MPGAPFGKERLIGTGLADDLPYLRRKAPCFSYGERSRMGGFDAISTNAVTVFDERFDFMAFFDFLESPLGRMALTSASGETEYWF